MPKVLSLSAFIKFPPPVFPVLGEEAQGLACRVVAEACSAGEFMLVEIYTHANENEILRSSLMSLSFNPRKF